VETDLFDSIIVFVVVVVVVVVIIVIVVAFVVIYMFYITLHKIGINAELVVASLPACSQCFVVNHLFMYVYVCIHSCRYE